MHASTLYRAEGLEPLVAISDDGRLMATLGEVMLGWTIVPAENAEPGAAAAIRIERGAKGWTCSGVTFDRPVTYADPVATACSLIAHLYKAHTLIDREGLFLHAAGVRIGTRASGGLVLLSGRYRAGKSVVATACAAAGLQVFSDDIIPLDASPGRRGSRSACACRCPRGWRPGPGTSSRPIASRRVSATPISTRRRTAWRAAARRRRSAPWCRCAGPRTRRRGSPASPPAMR